MHNVFNPFGLGLVPPAPQGGTNSTTLTLSLADSVDPAPAGNNYTYSAIVTNTGSAQANTLSLAVTLDSSLTFVSASGTGWVCGAIGQVVTCTRSSLAVGVAPTITITVTAGNSALTASTSGVCTCSNASNATATETTVISKLATTVTVTDSADPVISGADAFAYTITAHNSNSTGQLNGLSVAFTIDASLTYVSSSGTGWAFSGPTAGVLTCTLSSLAANSDAATITVNVTTGTSAVAASSSAQLTSTNGTTSNGSQGTTFQLVSKDATSGIYCPASSTEWTNFLARKLPAASIPSFLWLCQDASGALAETIGGTVTLAVSGTPAYAQTISGWSRKGLKTTDGASHAWSSTNTGLPDISATSAMLLMYAGLTTTPSVSGRLVANLGTSTVDRLETSGTTTPVGKTFSGPNNATGATTLASNTTIIPWVLKEDHTGALTRGYTNADKMSPTHSASVTGKKIVIGTDTGSAGGPMMYAYACLFTGSAAELSDANIKLLLQALGFTITWS